MSKHRSTPPVSPTPAASASAPASAAPSPAAAIPSGVPSVAGLVIPSSAQPENTTASEAARAAFWKMGREEEEGSTGAPAASANTDEQPDGAVSGFVKPGTETAPPVSADGEDTDTLPVYQEDDEQEAAAPDGAADGKDSGFTPPPWVAELAPELREKAEGFTKVMFEQTTKHKRRSSELEAKVKEVDTELASVKAERDELKKRPAVISKDQPLGDKRTKADVDAFAREAPARMSQLEALGNNGAALLAALQKAEDEGETTVEMFDQKWSSSDKAHIQQQLREASVEYAQLKAGVAAIPDRYAYLEKQRETERALAKTQPDALNPETPMGRALKKRVETYPGYQEDPEHGIVIADHLTMKMVRSGKYRLVKASAPTAKPGVTTARTSPTQTVGTGGSTAPVPRSSDDAAQVDIDALKARAEKGDQTAQRQLETIFFKV